MDKDELKKMMNDAEEAEKQAQAERSKQRAAARGKGDEPPAADAVSVHLPITQQTELVFVALAKSPRVGLVLYGGRPHRIARRDGKTVLEAHSRESLRGYIARTVGFKKRSKDDGWHETNPTLALMDDILTLPEYPEGVPVVRWIKSTPLLVGEGELIAESGLYPEYQTYLNLDATLAGLKIPQAVSAEDLDSAVETLLDVFRDFPVQEDSVANLVALIFTAVFREWIDGVTPLFIVDANTRGTGKGLLVSVVSIIAYGREMTFSPANVNSEELRKRLFSVGAQGDPMHALDNVEQTIWSPELAAWLTAPYYSDRKLGESTVQTFPNTLILVGTGNNVRLGGDIQRRSVLIRLNSEVARPEERDDFVYPELLAHVKRKRRRILRAVYTIAAAWLRQGKPVPASAPAMGSFQPWADFAAGILHTVGATGLLMNREQLRARDQDEEDHETMLVRARAVFGEKEFTAKELVSALDPEDFPTALGGGRLISVTKAMGRLLTRIEGRAFGDERLLVRYIRSVDKTKHYRIDVAPARAKRKGDR